VYKLTKLPKKATFMGIALFAVLIGGTILVTTVPSDETGEQMHYDTKAAAVAQVSKHVEPKNCFVWEDGPSDTPWRVIPGTGCAHWVAHQLNLKNGVGCYEGYSIRVSDVITGRTEYDIENAKIGDIWTTNDLGHCGIVREVGIRKVKVENDSSSQEGVVMEWCNSGRIYR
jgi:hypothetical protein